jgi:hypothetical protein
MTDPAGERPDPRARARVADVLARFERIDPEALSLIALPTPDAARREALRAEVDAAAGRTGRTGLLAEAEDEAREIVFRRFSESGFRPQPFGLNWLQSLGTAPDRAATAIAVVDAVAAAVVEDELPDEVVVELTAPFETLVTADLPGAGATLVGLEARPAWARAVLLVLAVGSAAVAVVIAATGNPIALLFGVLPVALIVAILRADRRARRAGAASAGASRLG